MDIIKKISVYIAKYMAIIVVVVAALAFFVPLSSTWIQTSWINYLLMIVMFGMGLTMKPKDFLVIVKNPKDVLVGFVAQFTIMPLIAYLLCKIFNLSPELTIGVILVGTCPGGTASNVITYFSQGRCIIIYRYDIYKYITFTIVNSCYNIFVIKNYSSY